MAKQNLSQPPTARVADKGFLPMKTNMFDRCFISVVCFIAIHLLWMRFLEANLSIWIATALSLVVAAVIITRG